MIKSLKYRALCFLASCLIYLIIWCGLKFVFTEAHEAYKIMISSVFAVILAPKIHIFKTQFRTKRQIKWIFLKKMISI